MKGILYLEDGTVLKGRGFGKKGTAVGELVFNTSMTGYQEIVTDPSYAGQVINMTYPLIGNYGVNENENESKKIYARGLIVKSICVNPSNYMSEEALSSMMERMNIVGVAGVDTRSITKLIRNSGTMKCVISNEDLTIEELQQYIDKCNKTNFVEEVSTKEIYRIEGKGHKVVLMDFGAKANIIENLKERNCDITVVPYNTSFEKIMELNPDGVMLSNGPGDPKDIPQTVEVVKKIVRCKPTFGICLGHQILALTFEADTYKMKFGHRGGNHGVYDIERDRAYITSQNHGYAVKKESIEDKDLIVTHINLNDNTVEGIRHKFLPVFSVQFHPEGSPGPIDSAYLFDNFIDSMNNNVEKREI
ncbi:glutamine-hydrolyzing carbamoyl-phosphate synthase small subunit [Clostridium sp. ZS2-4]|uniref:glutamine-hydrolyzing carbamoyl-phosphate synthase small subunit n=1 Tax=Clostridium sp. ZS2-4 TaxID=2987703 RepID=UPI00227D3C89|nr:glutamine-hydrolyzing carbamoyl-phosphate synthase small subunit [Clostridium sp. ZS2-4]MCY6355415.1 glutamine-hydrolyzing carbamoyl-phosphate synthase small subunit [Clostridium sp. ZS2-4]